MWRDWFNTSKTVWSSVLPNIVNRAVYRNVRMELDQVWEIRLDLLLEMENECLNEKQEMSMAIKIERATRQKIWKEFEVCLVIPGGSHQFVFFILIHIFNLEHVEGCFPVT